MPKPRSQQINLEITPYYHCVSRCVRRAFLCGKDPVSGKSYEHRRAWIQQRLITLSQAFAIDLCAFSIMHNHTHLTLYVDQARAKKWPIKEVIRRWHLLFSGTLFTQQYIKGERLSETALNCVKASAKVYRKRLINISWFMRSLNEPIARAANKEDDCTGRFWEGRFISQALLDDVALLTGMAYVDLNPIRAAIAKTPERSDYTSIKLRALAAKNGKQPKALAAFVGSSNKFKESGLPFALHDYLKLVDLTGRMIRNNKSGSIPQHCPPILKRLNISPENWSILSQNLEKVFTGAIGTPDSLTSYSKSQHLKRRQGINNSLKYFNTA